MPIALIKILEGRSIEKKRKLIESVSLAMSESLDMPIDAVRVVAEEVPPELWGRGGRTVADQIAAGSAAPPKSWALSRAKPHAAAHARRRNAVLSRIPITGSPLIPHSLLSKPV
jgi:4-oxalocrotonate tautomerase